MEGVAGESIVRVVISEAVSLGTWDLYFAPDSEEPEALTAYTTPPPLQPQLVYPSIQADPAGRPPLHTHARTQMLTSRTLALWQPQEQSRGRLPVSCACEPHALDLNPAPPWAPDIKP